MARLAARGATPQPFGPPEVFYHAALMPGWEPIVAEQCAVLRAAGLFRVNTFALSPGTEELARMRAIASHYGISLTILGTHPDFHRYETPTLQAAYDWARSNPDGSVLYFHTKGASNPADGHKRRWRRVMGRLMLAEWRTNADLLARYDVVGADWQHLADFPHFAGNFWAARCEWLSHLPRPDEYQASRPVASWAGHPWERMSAELWLGSRPYHAMFDRLAHGTLYTDDLWNHPFNIDGVNYDEPIYLGPLPSRLAAKPTGPLGVNVFGHFGYLTSGLRRAAELVAEGFEAAGAEVARYDVCIGARADPADAVERFPLSVFVVQPEPVSHWHRAAGVRRRLAARAALLHWETSRSPAGWAAVVRDNGAAEIWVPSAYCAAAIPGSVLMPYGVSVGLIAHSPTRPRDGAAGGDFLVVSSFDGNSTTQRKNPMALCAAFRAAFGDDPTCRLLFRASNAGSVADELRAAGAEVLTDSLARDEWMALIASSDCYAALHRSEGFGLPLAEAALLGIPVLCPGRTGEAGHVWPGLTYLCRAEEVGVPADVPGYSGMGTWFEPDIGAAARLLRELRADPAEAQRRATAARGLAIKELLPADRGRAMLDRLSLLPAM